MPNETPVYALAFAVFLQAILGGYFAGKLSQRVKSVEDNGDGHHGMAIQFAEFKGEVTQQLKSASENIAGLRGDLTWLRQAAVYEPEQARQAFKPRGGQ